MCNPPESEKIEMPAPPARVTPMLQWRNEQNEKQRRYVVQRAAWAEE
jgi:hypothetical protein